MYFDDFELELGLDSSFDAIVENELGQIGAEVSIGSVAIPQSELPDKKLLDAFVQSGMKDFQQFQHLYKTGQIPKKTGQIPKKVPKVSIIESPQDTSAFSGLKRTEMVEEIVKNLTDKLLPRLKKIDKRLKLAQAQSQATNEHNILMERALFRQQVIDELKWLSQLLPANHPVRLRINGL